jgi:hypothetical protein
MKLSQIDMFAIDVPGLNFEGKSKIRTGIGAFITLIMGTLTLAVAVKRIASMVALENFTTKKEIQSGHFLSPHDTLDL